MSSHGSPPLALGGSAFVLSPYCSVFQQVFSPGVRAGVPAAGDETVPMD